MRRWLVTTAAVLVSGAAMAEQLPLGPVPQGPAPGPLGQVILNPQPDRHPPSIVRRAAEDVAGLEPSAGPAATGCPQPDGWQVVVIRGGDSMDVVEVDAPPELAGGHMITVMPPGC